MKNDQQKAIIEPKKYTVREVFDSCYWEIGDDGEFDGFLHIVSTLTGSELKISIKKMFEKDFLIIPRQKTRQYMKKYNHTSKRMTASKHRYHKRLGKIFKNCELCKNLVNSLSRKE
jgi:hypothetical protein